MSCSLRSFAQVRTLVDNVKARAQRAGSPFAGRPAALANGGAASPTSVATASSRCESMYQRGVAKGLERLAASADRAHDLDARDLAECTFKPQVFTQQGPGAHHKKGAIATGLPQTSSPSKAEKAAAHAALLAQQQQGVPLVPAPGHDATEDGDALEGDRASPLHSKVADLLAKRKQRQQDHEQSMARSQARLPAQNAVTTSASGSIKQNEARALFDKFDANGDGVLDYDEFTEYLTSVFAALSHTPAFQAHGASPAQMAEATAQQCFEEADADGNGTLTFDEFQAWFETSPESTAAPASGTSGGGGGASARAQAALWQAACSLGGMAGVHARADEQFDDSAEWWLEFGPMLTGRGTDDSPAVVSLATAALRQLQANAVDETALPRALAQLLCRELGAAIEALDDSLEFDALGQGPGGGSPGFCWALKGLLLAHNLNGPAAAEDAQRSLSLVCLLKANQLAKAAGISVPPCVQAALEDALEAQGMEEGALDSSENDSRSVNDAPNTSAPQPPTGDVDGLLEEDDVRALFQKYDFNGDGVLDYEEFTEYLTSVFEALSHTPAFQSHGVTPAQMAEATAQQCFEEADADGNGTLTFEEFQNWYEASPAGSSSNRRRSSMTADPNGLLHVGEAAALFHEFDANGDGVLDFEVQGSFTTKEHLHFVSLVLQNYRYCPCHRCSLQCARCLTHTLISFCSAFFSHSRNSLLTSPRCSKPLPTRPRSWPTGLLPRKWRRPPPKNASRKPTRVAATT